MPSGVPSLAVMRAEHDDGIVAAACWPGGVFGPAGSGRSEPRSTSPSGTSATPSFRHAPPPVPAESSVSCGGCFDSCSIARFGANGGLGSAAESSSACSATSSPGAPVSVRERSALPPSCADSSSANVYGSDVDAFASSSECSRMRTPNVTFGSLSRAWRYAASVPPVVGTGRRCCGCSGL